MNITIDDEKITILKTMASVQGKTINRLVEELIKNYLINNIEKIERKKLRGIMKLSETSFAEWDNDEDEIYNSL
ncbi:CopG family transcriptional regulator [Candidatus Magnetomoraceae bacterium gMMP-15]